MSELSGYLYRCSAGETFDKVALDVFGNEKYAADLLNANPGYALVTVFTGGEVLSLPIVEIPENRNDYAPAKAPWKE